MLHELKTYPKYFQETIEGNKLFEIRKNDRNYTGREVGAMVRYILDDKFIGLAEGYVALGLQILT